MEWELTEAVEYYRRQGAPADQNALKELLREAQQANGGRIPQDCIGRIAQLLNTKKTFLEALIRRTPSLRLEDVHYLEVCAGPNCGKHIALAEFAEKCAGEKCRVKFVPCMRLCGKGPNIRWDGELYHRADVELLKKLIRQ